MITNGLSFSQLSNSFILFHFGYLLYTIVYQQRVLSEVISTVCYVLYIIVQRDVSLRFSRAVASTKSNQKNQLVSVFFTHSNLTIFLLPWMLCRSQRTYITLFSRKTPKYNEKWYIVKSSFKILSKMLLTSTIIYVYGYNEFLRHLWSNETYETFRNDRVSVCHNVLSFAVLLLGVSKTILF